MSQMSNKAGDASPASSGDMTSETASKDTQIGLFMALAAYGSWGIFPLYFSMLAHVPAVEVVAHRVTWSLVLMAVWFLIRKRWHEVWTVLRLPRVLGLLVITGLLVSSNWLTYVWAVVHARATEASLGYFIVPMVNVATGYLFLSERLSRLQIVAICLAVSAILLQMILLGTVPIISLFIALTFGAYGYLRKIVPVGPNLGLLVELIVITPIALCYILYLQANGQGHFELSEPVTMGLLIFSSVMTSLPLIWFSGAARRLNMTTIGIMQYLNPSIQFIIAVFVLKESITMSKLATFVLIWLSVAVYSYDALSKRRQKREKSEVS